MSRVGFEPTIQASKGAKTVHAVDSSATVTGASQFRQKHLNTSRCCEFVSEFLVNSRITVTLL
jgi:hypothetical protein